MPLNINTSVSYDMIPVKLLCQTCRWVAQMSTIKTCVKRQFLWYDLSETTLPNIQMSYTDHAQMNKIEFLCKRAYARHGDCAIPEGDPQHPNVLCQSSMVWTLIVWQHNYGVSEYNRESAWLLKRPCTSRNTVYRENLQSPIIDTGNVSEMSCIEVRCTSSSTLWNLPSVQINT